MKYVPEGAEPVEAYRKGDLLVVCGEPVEGSEEGDQPDDHNCDAMGCSSVNHVIFRQKVTFR
jgi:hypothetical protein